MNNLSWMSRYPELYKQERQQVEVRFKGLKFCETDFNHGQLAYHGEIPVRLSTGTIKHKILLTYPHLFPANPPVVKPIKELPTYEPHERLMASRISARHQMADGSLCLVEQDPFRDRTGIIRGIDILRRTSQWYFSIESGHNPYDSLEADIQSHMMRLGDILLGPEFYGDDLNKGGYFYAAQYPGSSEGTYRLVGLAYSSDFESLIKFKDCRKTLENCFAWISNDVWNTAENISTNRESLKQLLQSKQIIRGFWWDLEKEPLPPRSGLDLLNLISGVDDGEQLEKTLNLFSSDVNIEQLIYIGLRFPDRKGGYDWLFCCLRLRSATQKTAEILTYDQKKAIFERAVLFVLFRHPIRQKELMLRNQGRIPINISDQTVSLLGVGSVGSTIADLLAKAGVGTFRLYDYDRMQTGNVIRHESGIEYFGELKVHTTFWNIMQHNPFAEVHVNPINLSDSYQTVDEALSNCNLVISSTANESLETVINEVAVIKPQTIYYVRAMRGGAAGRIFRVIPGRDACRYCLSQYLNDSPNEIGKWLLIPEISDSLISYECGNPILAASGADLTIVSSLCTKIVLKDIENDFGDDNHWLWASEPIAEHPELSESYKLVHKTIPPLPNCPFCSASAVKTIIIPKDVQAKIENLTLQSGANETGGIFVGYIDENKNVIVTGASNAGPNAKCSPTRFLKDIAYTQEWLDNEIRYSSQKIEYIGEWHCHTNSDTTPSITDVTSLNGIAESPNYLCKTPVMLILGSDGKGTIVKKSAYSFSQNRPYQEIQFKVMD